MRSLLRVAAIGFLLSCSRPASAGDFKPFALRTPAGKAASFADVKGKKATLVVFFFPSCGYCSVAYPAMQKLRDDYHERGLELVWVNTIPDQEENVPAWIEKHGATVPVLVGATQKSLERDYGLRMTPTIVLVDGNGKVRYKRAGYKKGDEAKLDREIREVLTPAP